MVINYLSSSRLKANTFALMVNMVKRFKVSNSNKVEKINFTFIAFILVVLII